MLVQADEVSKLWMSVVSCGIVLTDKFEMLRELMLPDIGLQKVLLNE